MDLTLAGASVPYTPDDDQLARLSIELAAFDGEVGNGSIPVLDPTTSQIFPTGRQARFDEGTTLLSDGFILDRDRIRGPIPAAAYSEPNYGLADANALLGGFRIRENRPVETDYARVMGMIATRFPAWDTSMVLNASTVSLPFKQYDTDGGFADLISDLVEFTGKTLFLHDKADGSGRCLHYHLLTNGHSSGLAISDVIADVDFVTTWYPIGPSQQRTSVDLINDVMGRASNGRIALASDPTSIAAHDADGLPHEALIDFDTTSQADLNVKTAAFLASQKDDLVTYGCTIGPLGETELALIRPGDLIPCTSTVMGLTASTQRIAHMELTPAIGEGGRAVPDKWYARLELGAPVRRRARVKPGPALAQEIVKYLPPPFTPGGCGPWETWGALGDWIHVNGSPTGGFDFAPGAIGGYWSAADQASAVQKLVDIQRGFDIPRATVISGMQARVSWNFDALHDFILSYGNEIPYLTVNVRFQISGGASLSARALEERGSGISAFEARVGPGATVNSDVFGAGLGWDRGTPHMLSTGITSGGDGIATSDIYGPYTSPYTIPAGFTVDGVVYVTVTIELSVYMNWTFKTPDDNDPNHGSAWMTVVDLVDDSGNSLGFWCTPSTNQEVRHEIVGTGDGIETVFTTNYPYVPGSLRAYANDLPEFLITETDPAAGTFTFDSPPFDGEVISVDYTAA